MLITNPHCCIREVSKSAVRKSWNWSFVWTFTERSKAQVLLNSGSQIINESQSAEFWCKVSGSPQPKITWQRHGQSLGECGPRWGAINCESFSERHELTFRNDTSFLRVSEAKFLDDAGSYSCYVENLAGAGKATLQVIIQGKRKKSLIPSFCYLLLVFPLAFLDVTWVSW